LAQPSSRNSALSLATKLYVYCVYAVLAVFLVATAAGLSTILMRAITGNGSPHAGGASDGVRYWLPAGKPPRLREVSAGYYGAAYALEAIAMYGLLGSVVAAAALGGAARVVVATLRRLRW
jgi:hypothetical protein